MLVCCPTLIETAPKNSFERFNSIFWSKIVDYAFVSCCAEIKRSPWVLSQRCTRNSTIQRIGQSIRRWFEPMCESSHWLVNNDSSALVRFLNCYEDFWQTSAGLPLRIDRTTMLKCNSRHMTSFAEKAGYHLLRSDFSTNNFR